MATRTSPVLRQYVAALRTLLVLTVITGVVYPLALTGIAQVVLHDNADGSLVRHDGATVGSDLVGQGFTRPVTKNGSPVKDADGNPVMAADPRYFQSRPSAAGDGYDPTSTSASNLGPESIVDTPDGESLLTQVCARSLAVGDLEGVDGSRPYCTADGVGAVLAVFRRDGFTGPVTRVVAVNQTGTPFVATYDGVMVEPAQVGEDYQALGGVMTAIRGAAPAAPFVPADAVTASASGLDPDISPAYAALQVPRVARERGVPAARVRALVDGATSGRTLGFLGEPRVDVLGLNQALDRQFPVSS